MATFGKTAVGSWTHTTLLDDIRGSLGSPTDNGIASKISLYIDSNWAEGEAIRCALYDTSDDSFVAETEELDTGLNNGSWNDFNFSPPVTVLAAVNYAVVFYMEDNASFRYGTSIISGVPQHNNAGYPIWPDPLTTVNNYDFSVYCTYETGTALGLAGTVNGVSSVTGAIETISATVLGLVGTSAGTSNVTGAIGANPVSVSGLAGTVAGVSSVTGAVRKIATSYLTGTVTGVSSVTGAIGANPGVVSSLAGEIVGISSVTGSVFQKGEDVILSFPSTRASDYDPDLVWDEDTGTWTSDEDLLRRDGSRHKTQLVVVGKDLIYFGAID